MCVLGLCTGACKEGRGGTPCWALGVETRTWDAHCLCLHAGGHIGEEKTVEELLTAFQTEGSAQERRRPVPDHHTSYAWN